MLPHYTLDSRTYPHDDNVALISTQYETSSQFKSLCCTINKQQIQLHIYNTIQVFSHKIKQTFISTISYFILRVITSLKSRINNFIYLVNFLPYRFLSYFPIQNHSTSFNYVNHIFHLNFMFIIYLHPNYVIINPISPFSTI